MSDSSNTRHAREVSRRIVESTRIHVQDRSRSHGCGGASHLRAHSRLHPRAFRHRLEEATKLDRSRATEDFPVGKTLLAVYKNPIHGPTVGLADQIPCWVRRTSESQIFRSSTSTARISVAPCTGSRSPSSSCVPAMAVSTTRTVPVLRGRHLEVSSNTTGRSFVTGSTSSAARCPTFRFPESFRNPRSRR